MGFYECCDYCILNNYSLVTFQRWELHYDTLLIEYTQLLFLSSFQVEKFDWMVAPPLQEDNYSTMEIVNIILLYQQARSLLELNN